MWLLKMEMRFKLWHMPDCGLQRLGGNSGHVLDKELIEVVDELTARQKRGRERKQPVTEERHK